MRRDSFPIDFMRSVYRISLRGSFSTASWVNVRSLFDVWDVRFLRSTLAFAPRERGDKGCTVDERSVVWSRFSKGCSEITFSNSYTPPKPIRHIRSLLMCGQLIKVTRREKRLRSPDTNASIAQERRFGLFGEYLRHATKKADGLIQDNGAHRTVQPRPSRVTSLTMPVAPGGT